MTRRTKGPWMARESGVFAGKNCIAVCDTDNATQEVYEANADLMAAAPIMAEFIELMAADGNTAAIIMVATLKERGAL